METNNMIIGNNGGNNQTNGFTKPLGNHFENNQFKNKNQQFEEQMSHNQPKNIFTREITAKQHVNPTSKNDMYDKTLALLHERLNQGAITLEEFNRKCRELSKKRQK